MALVLAKLLYSAATLLVLLAFLVRPHDARAYDARVNAALFLFPLLAVFLGVWGTLIAWPLQPAYWLVEWLGSPGRARAAMYGQQGLAVLAWLALLALAVAERQRMPIAGLLVRLAPLLWAVAYTAGMFGYY